LPERLWDSRATIVNNRDLRPRNHAKSLTAFLGSTVKSFGKPKVQIGFLPPVGCQWFQIDPAKVSVKGKLPDGALDEVQVQVASVVPFLVMKGMALEDRRKAKDAYDIYFVLHNYPGGLEANGT
jgi:hypothetical protein